MTEDADQANSAPIQEPAAAPSPKRVVLWGAGLANLRFLAAFAKHPTPHTLITLITPLSIVINPRRLAEWVAGSLPLDACATDIAQVVERSGVQWIQNNAVALDAGDKTLLLDDGRTLAFDLLSINNAAKSQRDSIEMNLPGVREHAMFVAPLEKFASLWPRVCELGETRPLRLSVIGAGTPAFELAMAIRKRMPLAAVTWLPGPSERQQSYPAELHQHMRAALKAQRVDVLFEPVTALTHDDILLTGNTRLACDVPILVIPQSAPEWLESSGLDTAEMLRFGEAPSTTVASDAFERSTNHPHIFFVDKDSSVLAHNLSCALSPEKPQALRAAPKDPLKIFFSAHHYAIAYWRGRSAQGRWVKWLKRYLKL
jgi:NADH dehydrogenase FAD-containing subunit